MYATTGGVCARHCSTVFMKHVFPRLRSPTPMPPLALDDPLDIGVGCEVGTKKTHKNVYEVSK